MLSVLVSEGQMHIGTFASRGEKKRMAPAAPNARKETAMHLWMETAPGFLIQCLVAGAVIGALCGAGTKGTFKGLLAGTFIGAAVFGLIGLYVSLTAAWADSLSSPLLVIVALGLLVGAICGAGSTGKLKGLLSGAAIGTVGFAMLGGCFVLLHAWTHGLI